MLQISTYFERTLTNTPLNKTIMRKNDADPLINLLHTIALAGDFPPLLLKHKDICSFAYVTRF